MRNLLFLLSLAFAFNLSAQLEQEVARLDSAYDIAVQISDDPVTTCQRVAAHKTLLWDSEKDLIISKWFVYSYIGDSLVLNQSVRNPYARELSVNRGRHVDSLGTVIPQEVADTLANSSDEYQYFIDLIKGGAVLFDVIEYNVHKADSLGKFD